MRTAVVCALLLALLAVAAPTTVLADVAGFPFSSVTDVCNRWNADFALTATAPYSSAVISTCTVGATTADAKTEAVRTVNLFRWVTGLEPLGQDATQDTNTTAGALLCAANKKLQHGGWPESSTCYTAAGNRGTQQSNLAGGSSSTMTPRFMVELWVDDAGVASLGHRRWVLGWQTSPVSFGYASSPENGAWATLYTQYGTGSPVPTAGYSSFPPRGWAPSWVTRLDTWHVTAANVGKLKTCLVKTCPGNQLVSGDCRVDTSNYGGNQAAIAIPLRSGVTISQGYYNVLVEFESSTNSSITTQVAYTTKIVDCDNTASFNGTCDIDPADIKGGGGGGSDNSAARAAIAALVLVAALVAALLA